MQNLGLLSNKLIEFFCVYPHLKVSKGGQFSQKMKNKYNQHMDIKNILSPNGFLQNVPFC